MIIIKTLQDLKSYLKIEKLKKDKLFKTAYNFHFYTDGKLDDVLFVNDTLINSLELLKDEEDLDVIANTKVEIKANSIKAKNLSTDYIFTNYLECENLNATYSIECLNLKAKNIETLSIKTNGLEANKILCQHIDCNTLICDECEFYILNCGFSIKAQKLKGVILNCPNIICKDIQKVKNK